jgi:hypothetical protein
MLLAVRRFSSWNTPTKHDGIFVIVNKRIAILGLYNSGSTVLAGMLHRMGVNMGAPFWTNSHEGHPKNFYEPWDLSLAVRDWWAEPFLCEQTPRQERISFLKSWADSRQPSHAGPLGAKHPLLSLCAADLLSAWGPDTIFVRAWRPFEESVDGLRARGWFTGHEIALQMRLWNALAQFERAHGFALVMDWNRVRCNPSAAVAELAEIVGLKPSPTQAKDAASTVRLPTTQISREFPIANQPICLFEA